MDYKTISFSHLAVNASQLQIKKDDFVSIIKQESFFLEESDEALVLMSEEEKASVKKFDSQFM